MPAASAPSNQSSRGGVTSAVPAPCASSASLALVGRKELAAVAGGSPPPGTPDPLRALSPLAGWIGSFLTGPSKSAQGRHAVRHTRRHLEPEEEPLLNKVMFCLDKVPSSLNKVNFSLSKTYVTDQAMRHGGPSLMRHGQTCSRPPR